MPQYSLGLDYGTNSVRALLVDVSDGSEVATAVSNYGSGNAGVIEDSTDPNLARQNPADYVEGFYQAVQSVMKQAGVNPEDIVGIGVDTTGSTPIPVDESCVPLAMHDAFKHNPAAHAWLWKDHTSFAEALEITDKARNLEMPYLAKCGGAYSSEWFWSKILHCARVAPEVFDSANSWVELADWVPAWLTGQRSPQSLVRGVCAAGHKAMYADEWGGLPSKEFLATLDPRLASLRDRLYDSAVPGDRKAGSLIGEIAAKAGLKVGTPVAVGAFDAHFGAVGAGIKTGSLVKIMGTSTCDCMVHPLDEPLEDIPGLCGIVRGSVLPNYYGLEAGQSAVGDIFNWFVAFVGKTHEELTAEASRQPAGASGLLALDWHNGNRTVLVDPLLSGLIVGQTLHTTPAETYRALVEATAFGALMIVRRLEEYGVAVKEVVNCGGIAEKNPFVMQIYADAMNRPMKVSRSAQTCALGSAIFGSVVGGAHRSVEEARDAMTGTKPVVYEPEPLAAAVYARLFKLYTDLHDAFGTSHWNGSLVHTMKDLIQIRREARS
ncbi:MAG TPA: ribulokinase [Fimbriimonas sp.]|nr:ribulokinase [Fimbriimonas sp.]